VQAVMNISDRVIYIIYIFHICILNTNLDKQGCWASVTRRLRNMDIQASRGGHGVQTKDVGGILSKQKKSEERHEEGLRFLLWQPRRLLIQFRSCIFAPCERGQLPLY
jgi:hypothetical protein